MQIRTWRLLVVLGLAGSFCTAESAIRFSEPIRKIAPLVAQAYTSRVNITLERQPNESFQTLTRRAETVARAAAQRSFDNDILVTQAAVIVTGEHIGLSAPILTLEVSRDNWKNYPNAQRWSTYYPNSKALLKIDDPTPTPVAAATGEGRQRPEPTLGTGVIQSTLRWSTTDDLDLSVTDPSGQRVFYQNKKVASGGELDVDSNADCQDTITNPVENVFWPATGAPPGNYVVRVNLYKRCATQQGPIPFRLRLLVQGRTQELTGTVDANKQTVSFPVSLAAGGAAPGQPANNRNNAPAGTGNQRQRPNSGTTNRNSNRTRNNTQQNNSTNPTNRTGTNNNNQTGTQSTPNQQTNTQPNRPRSRATYGEGLIRRTRELRDEINNRPPTDVPEN
ncbi:hypothetical protein NIES2119_20760 [[Phormidium ambiguum] IAM M-71]|uniref:DUF2135 domain-containing protein n=1 Tax=[Phormidium ambiguum] IAM M-71 TaxID=454136 RepID=A0A1U7IET3_9CYAN|nr:DUF2135 domain-containing protein [Phormidium ambiguum]OKH35444.1 hypothetical protein NIES2119_20760 [Phormidium ambiguum IAM M-71]